MIQNQLRVLRKRLKFTQAELAKAAHTHRSLIISVERLGHYPTPRVRRKIATALSVSEATIWPGMVTGGK